MPQETSVMATSSMRLLLALLACSQVPHTAAAPLQFELEWSEIWEEELLQKGREFTLEHGLKAEEYDTLVLDANGARVKRGTKPDRDNFPLRMQFKRKKDLGAQKSVSLEHHETWQEEMGKLMKEFAAEHEVAPDKFGVSVLDKDGKQVQHNKRPDASRFPLNVTFILPETKPEQPTGPPGFTLQYSENWAQEMGERMKDFGEKGGFTPQKYNVVVYDNRGHAVETGKDLDKSRFPIRVSFHERQVSKPSEPKEGPEAPAGMENDMSGMSPEQTAQMASDIRCDFCELAAELLAKSAEAKVGSKFKRSDDILAKIEDFCDGSNGEQSIANTLLGGQIFVFWNFTEIRWKLVNLGAGAGDESSTDMVDPKFRMSMKAGIDAACERVVDEHQVELSEALFRRYKKKWAIGRDAIYEELCVGLAKACGKGSKPSWTSDISSADKKSEL